MELRPRLTNAQYHADHSAWSSSQISVFATNRQQFYRRFVARTEVSESSAQMNLGTATHSLSLEPETFKSQVTVIPSWALSNGARRGKRWESFAAENAGKILITRAEATLVERMSRALHDLAGEWLDAPGLTEHSFFWRDADTGLRLKARPDKVLMTEDGTPLIVDVKTSSDASPEGFSRSFDRFGYGIQESHYKEAVRLHFGVEPLYRFVVVQNRDPIIANSYRTDSIVAQHERDRWRKAVSELAHCLATGNWEETGHVDSTDDCGW